MIYMILKHSSNWRRNDIHDPETLLKLEKK
jgi:hypothetical protein